MSGRTLVVGVGNTDCGDDAVGPLAAQRLGPLVGARVITRRGDALGLIEDWMQAGGVVLIDAALGNCAVGDIHRFELGAWAAHAGGTLARAALPSTHGFGVAEAIELARALGRLPRQLILYAVEGRQFTPGSPMSAAVRAALPALVERVRADVHRLEAMSVEGAGACTSPE